MYTYLPLLSSRAQDQTWSDGVPMYCMYSYILYYVGIPVE